MRLLVVSQYFWPENFRVNDLVVGLTGRGHEVTILTGHPNYPEGKIFPSFRKDPGRFSAYAGAKVIRVPLVPRGKGSLCLVLNYLSFIFSSLFLGPLRLRGQSFDAIFIFQSSPVTVALPAILLRRLKRAPALMWILDLWPESLSAVGRVTSPRLLGLVGRMVTFIYRRCDLLLLQSKAFTANVQGHGACMPQLRYFPGWAEPLFKQPLTLAPRAPELAFYQETFNILFAGNLGEAQDFPAILDAVASLEDLPQVRWLVVGDGRMGNQIKTEIQSRGLENRVILLGRHPIERMPSFFRGAHALLVTLRKDPIFSLTIPGKVQSYLASGIPLLGMLDGEGARIILEAEAGLVAPAGDGSLLADNVRTLAAMTVDERSAMGRRGQKYCNHEFDRDHLLASLEFWIRECRAKGTEDQS